MSIDKETIELPPAKILTIDDEYVLRQSIVAYLEDSGFEIYEAENGKQGIEVFEAEKPDLVLTDLQMPVMGGLKVLEHITESSPETPVVVVSGAGGMTEAIDALRLGAWDYITKPISDMAVLEHTVNKCLERSRLIAENKIYRAKLEKNLRTLEEDQVAGRTVQNRLLPEGGGQFGQYLCDHRVVPSLYLSGDFVDYFPINENQTCVYLADVSGHGASSAFITVLLKSLMSQMYAKYQAEQDDTILLPEKMMSHLSDAIYTAKLGKYMTLCYFVMDYKKHVMQYGVGGHYPNPMLLSSQGVAKYLPGEGFPVGILPKATFKSYEVSLEPGEQIVMFTDGVMEVFETDKSLETQTELLLKLVEDCHADIESIYKHLGVSSDLEQPDDVTMLTIKRNA